MRTIPLRFVTFRVFDENRYCETVFEGGAITGATREDTEQNRTQAVEQGYTGPDAVWQSLVEHELMHNLVAEVLLNQPSPTLLFEAGRAQTPLALREWEEGIVLSLQRYRNTGEILLPLKPYEAQLGELMVRFREAEAALCD